MTLKAEFREWLEKEQEYDEMIGIAHIPCILSKLDSKLAIVRGNSYEKKYLRFWITCFKFDRHIDRLIHK
ncbi:TPA: tRNA delta(2)-isopentenylpyrophosphate transferase [Pasteurella multocida]|nr:tRNA delta(2)-isopentenylpyrophosphate transferase [Pasteurella multocida]